jgi:hypothetical protein
MGSVSGLKSGHVTLSSQNDACCPDDLDEDGIGVSPILYD